MSISPASTLELLTPFTEAVSVKRYSAKLWRNKTRMQDWYELHREQLQPDESPIFDYGTVPGEAVSAQIIESQKECAKLLALINRFADCGLGWVEQTEAKITVDTAAAATAFLSRLNDVYVLPRIAPDGEGAMMMVWEGHGDPAVGVVDGWKLHLVSGAGTPHAHYIDDAPFDGESIPESILRRIPLR